MAYGFGGNSKEEEERRRWDQQEAYRMNQDLQEDLKRARTMEKDASVAFLRP